MLVNAADMERVSRRGFQVRLSVAASEWYILNMADLQSRTFFEPWTLVESRIQHNLIGWFQGRGFKQISFQLLHRDRLTQNH
jgi:hypothetical protein